MPVRATMTGFSLGVLIAMWHWATVESWRALAAGDWDRAASWHTLARRARLEAHARLSLPPVVLRMISDKCCETQGAIGLDGG